MRASKAMLIDEFMPEYDGVERHSIDVCAPSKNVLAAVKALDLTDSKFVRVLFKLRETASIFSFEKKRQTGLGLTLDGLLKSGFILLGERPNEEILLGVAGRFWTACGDIKKLNREQFSSFDQPGYAKAVWNFSLEESENKQTRLRTETRVRCLDSKSRRRFLAYWTIIKPFSGLVRKEALRAIKRAAEADHGIVRQMEIQT